ncbi:MAG: cysteine hydrolase [Erysipelotrichaceae bacterium]|nr:cysteine hydrolase [Erysipelotrichaceae bacterium]
MNKLLVVVDYQKDFVDGSLGNEAAVAIKDNVVAMIKSYQERGDDVIFTLDTHNEDYMSTYEGLHLPVPHCIKGTDGHQLYGELGTLVSGCQTFEKGTFPSLALANYLADKDYQEVGVIGVVTDICVLSNCIMIKSALPNAAITVYKDCCASNDPVQEQKAYDVMKGSLQINVE